MGVMNEFCELTAFLDWWLNTRALLPPESSTQNHEDKIDGAVLYRDGPFQVQLFIVKPNSEIKPHVHPDVDSYEVYVSGDIRFMCDGVWHDQAEVAKSRILRVRPSSWHGGEFGGEGGVFLSVQRWLNGVSPTSVGDNWSDEAGRTRGSADAISGADSGTDSDS